MCIGTFGRNAPPVYPMAIGRIQPIFFSSAIIIIIIILLLFFFALGSKDPEG